MRIVLTVVGLSLFDDMLKQDLVKLADEVGALPQVDRHDLRQDLAAFRDYVKDIAQRTTDSPAAYADFTDQCDRQPGVGHVAEILRALWSSALDDKIKRAHSPAELASLSLLTPKLSRGDQARLLYSETPTGALCSAILAAVLRGAGTDSSLCGAGVLAPPPIMLAGVQIKDPARLAREGIESWAKAIDGAQRDACHAADRVLLNVTGGYKGLAPLAALLAFGLSRGDKPIDVFYLYEGSEELLILPGSNLVGFDLKLFDDFRDVWRQLPAGGMPWPDQQSVLTHAFVREVVDKRADLITRSNTRLELTTTGQLLLAVWKVRLGMGVATPQAGVTP